MKIIVTHSPYYPIILLNNGENKHAGVLNTGLRNVKIISGKGSFLEHLFTLLHTL